MVIALVCLGWSAVALVIAVVVGGGVRLADERAEADAWRVPLLHPGTTDRPVMPGQAGQPVDIEAPSPQA